MTTLTENVNTAEEMQSLRRHSSAKAPDVLDWLVLQIDLRQEVSIGEFQKGDLADYNVINPAEEEKENLHKVVKEVMRLRVQNAQMTEALKNRITVALTEARDPPWVPTHRHYKGTEYRVIGRVMCADHEELEEMVLYDDLAGRRFVLSRRRWESRLESGRPRYEFLYDTTGQPRETSPGSGSSGGERPTPSPTASGSSEPPARG